MKSNLWNPEKTIKTNNVVENFLNLSDKLNEIKASFEVGNKYSTNIVKTQDGSAERHPYHLVQPSPLPVLLSMGLFWLMSSFLQFLTGGEFFYSIPSFATKLIYLGVLIVAYLWFWTAHYESTYLGKHTKQVKRGLRMGVKIFILSEVMVFVGAFWAYLHGALGAENIFEGYWPPLGINVGHWYLIPTLETFALVFSGLTLTRGYSLFLRGDRQGLIVGLGFTIGFAVYFLFLQYIEFTSLLSFTIADSFFGSSFYFAVGCHGMHVIIGTAGLITAFVRHLLYHFVKESHVGLQAVIWYWNFVDIVWLFLYAVFYVYFA